MGREADVADETQMLAVEVEVLQAGARPVGHDERGLAARSVVEPQAVWCFHLARFLADAAPRADPIGVLVVLENVMRAITVTDVKAAVWPKRDVGGAVLHRGVLIHAGLWRASLDPNKLALQRRLGDHIVLDVA